MEANSELTQDLQKCRKTINQQKEPSMQQHTKRL